MQNHWTGKQSENDCVITAISNLTGIPYKDVEAARDLAKGKTAKGSTLIRAIDPMCKLLGYRTVEVMSAKPSTNTPCLYCIKPAPRSKMGHCVAVIDGVAIEASGKTWDTRTSHYCSIACIYLYPLS